MYIYILNTHMCVWLTDLSIYNIRAKLLKKEFKKKLNFTNHKIPWESPNFLRFSRKNPRGLQFFHEVDTLYNIFNTQNIEIKLISPLF